MRAGVSALPCRGRGASAPAGNANRMKNRGYSAPEPSFWEYELGGGWKVYAGKTAEDNDLLSLRFARDDDLWFHVHGQPGSHVLLRGPEGEAAVRVLIEQAAAIAAWHSKARNGGTCSVDCTFARNVSKPRGVPAGTVEIRESRKFRVKPGLPE